MSVVQDWGNLQASSRESVPNQISPFGLIARV